MYILFSQLMVSAIVNSSLYALYGVSWGVIYRTTKIFHFSHHLIFTIAGYSAALVTTELGLSFHFGLISSILSAVVLGCAIDKLLYRSLRKMQATQTTTFLASMGFATAGVGFILLFLSSNPRPLTGFPNEGVSIGAAAFTTVDIAMVVGSWSLILALIIFLSKTSYGKAIQAVGSNSEMAINIGLDPDKIYSLVFAIGSAVFGVAAFLFTAKNTAYPTMGMFPFFMSFTAVFLGGVRSIKGHALAGVVLGFAEAFGMVILPGEFKSMIVFGVLIFVIILKPEGLLSGSRG